ncbi:MAG: OsmC family protein [Chloroflexi bacterium]|nr:OsmC family protein [Chloroflexota bacterium]
MPVELTLGEGTVTTIRIRGHEWHADEPLEAGGSDTGPTPGEMMLGALGSCMAITCRLYAERKGWDLQGVDVALDYERFRGRDYPAHTGDDLFVHEVREALVFHGDLDDKQLARLRDIAGKCPVHRLLAYPTYFVDLELDED